MRRRAFLKSNLGHLVACASITAGPRSLFTAGPARGDDRPAATSKIKIGQIGTGHAHAGGKFAAVRGLNELYDLVGIVEADDDLRARAEKSSTYADAAWLTEEQLLATPELAAVVVETPMTDSAAAASRAIAAGKHVHLDKPGALRHEDFRTMRNEAERHGLTVQMGYMLRYNPAFMLLFRAAREGWFGDVLEIDCSMGKLASAEMRRELATLPGSGMFELACHIIDATVTVLGKPEHTHAFGKRSQSEAGALVDNQLAVLEFPRATATIRCNHADPYGGPHRRFQLVGTRGGMEISPLESNKFRLWLSEPHEEYKKGEQTISLPAPPGRYDWEFVDLAKVIRKERPLAWNAAHDIAVHETVLRAAGIWDDA
ncbi:MAG: gfo/Idh/MocA family oxidoreductase [Pirellula sp.]|nr:gfo/Idh/MocA family oxidoreductase [Pirellula sp.]